MFHYTHLRFRRFLTLVLGIMYVGLSAVHGAPESKSPEHKATSNASNNPSWTLGQHYEELVPALPRHTTGGKIEVAEVFWYSCPHCNALEPYLTKWLSTKPSDVEFIRIPVTWTAANRSDAQLFFALQALGRLDLHQAVYDHIHINHQSLRGTSELETLGKQTEFASAHGINAAQFKATYKSAAVQKALADSDAITRAYRIRGVPSFVVNGRYTTDIGLAGSSQRMIDLLNYLISVERNATAKRDESKPGSKPPT